ncbi:MAG: hypothetical protein MZV64_35830 [Ignavibacteriales bacterium]|nr:hypothetical protein [Ignavibacteriales bacterium]
MYPLNLILLPIVFIGVEQQGQLHQITMIFTLLMPQMEMLDSRDAAATKSLTDWQTASSLDANSIQC